jgi:GNAT superfamily N-acetyltransferase
MDFKITIATPADRDAITTLIQASVRGLQDQYSPAQREAALRTVFTVDSHLLADGTYFLATCDGVLAGCGGWSYRRTLYGGDHQVGQIQQQRLDPATDAARIRAIFVHPTFARRGLGSLILSTAEDAARAAGFHRFEMGSTLAGVPLYLLKGYVKSSEVQVPVGDGYEIEIVRMIKSVSGPIPSTTEIGHSQAT